MHILCSSAKKINNYFRYHNLKECVYTFLCLSVCANLQIYGHLEANAEVSFMIVVQNLAL